MKPYIFIGLALFLGSSLFCCQERYPHEDDIRLMANLQCEARRLKEERFRIANELRFRSDSLMKLNIPLSTAQKQEEDSIKALYTARTGEAAVRLTQVMDSLFETRYQTSAQRQEFDAAVEKKLQEVCP